MAKGKRSFKRSLRYRWIRIIRAIYSWFTWFKKKPTYFHFTSLILIAVTIAFIAVAIYIWEFHSQPFSSDPGKWGSLGDFFGGLLNPVFSFAALVLLLITIQQQRRELRYSRVELERSATALNEQSDTLKKQNFETTFFNWIEVHHLIVQGLVTYRLPDEPAVSGKKVFREYYENLQRIFESRGSDASIIVDVYKEFYTSGIRQNVGHYFHNLYHLVKFTADYDRDHETKYVDVIRSQLSPYELLLVFYNCCYYADEGNDKFKKLIEKTALLKSIGDESLTRLLLNPEEDIVFYSMTAYGDEYDLNSMRVSTPNELASCGQSLAIIALVNAKLYIRIFDANGSKIIDKEENELVDTENITVEAFKQQLHHFLDESTPSLTDKRKIIKHAISIAGHTHGD